MNQLLDKINQIIHEVENAEFMSEIELLERLDLEEEYGFYDF